MACYVGDWGWKPSRYLSSPLCKVGDRGVGNDRTEVRIERQVQGVKYSRCDEVFGGASVCGLSKLTSHSSDYIIDMAQWRPTQSAYPEACGKNPTLDDIKYHLLRLRSNISTLSQCRPRPGRSLGLDINAPCP